MHLADLTSADFATAVNPNTVVILPVGAVEAHGPHLPLAADILQPMAVAEEVSAKTGALIAPPIHYGLCGSTRLYPGSITTGFDSLRAYVRDILADLHRNGVRLVVVLSGHAGREHMAALRLAAQEVVAATGLDVAVLSDYDIVYGSTLVPRGDGHAGTVETSRVMRLRPDLVKALPKRSVNRTPKYAIVADPRKHWPGVTGNPRRADVRLAKRLDALIVREIVKLVQAMGRPK
jgi:creatinine amidohydrolase